MDIHRNRLLRRMLLPLFSRLNPGDIRIRHHWTGDRILLHSYRHKGFWFHGKRRERLTLQLLGGLIAPGDVVLDVGGHIGYFALYFAHLTGEGAVHVFEPGPNNLPYVRENTAGHPSVQLIEKGVGKEAGTFTLFVEDLTGQNNSFVADYDMFEANRRAAFSDSEAQPVEVEVVTLDGHCEAHGLHPNFIKIDVEGFELEALQGAERLLREDRPVLMVEVSRQHAEVLALLRAAGYRTCDDRLLPIEASGDLELNTFCFPEERAAELLRRLG